MHSHRYCLQCNCYSDLIGGSWLCMSDIAFHNGTGCHSKFVILRFKAVIVVIREYAEILQQGRLVSWSLQSTAIEKPLLSTWHPQVVANKKLSDLSQQAHTQNLMHCGHVHRHPSFLWDDKQCLYMFKLELISMHRTCGLVPWMLAANTSVRFAMVLAGYSAEQRWCWQGQASIQTDPLMSSCVKTKSIKKTAKWVLESLWFFAWLCCDYRNSGSCYCSGAACMQPSLMKLIIMFGPMFVYDFIGL